VNLEIKERIDQVQRGEVPKGYKSEFPYIIPNDWHVTRLGTITTRTSRRNKNDADIPACSINNQVGFVSQSEQFDGGSYVDLDKTAYKVVLEGEFAYNPARINVGSIGRLNHVPEAIVSSLYVCFKLNGKHDGVYFENWFDSYDFYKEVVRNLEGSVREYLFYENFSNIKMPLPPVVEEKKIAEILAQCNNVIRLKKQLIDEKLRQKKWMMKKIFNNKKSVNRLGSFVEVVMGQSPASTSYNDTQEGLPLIQGNADITKRVSTPKQYTSAPTKICNPGDLLLSVRAPVGCVSKSTMKACIGRGVCALRPQKHIEYVYQFLQYFEDKWNGISQGSTFDAICGDDIKKLEIPSYSDDIVQRIELLLSCSDHEIDLLEQELALWKTKQKSLMQLLLTGLVRVKI